MIYKNFRLENMKNLFLFTILFLGVTHANSQTTDIVTYKEKSQLEWKDFKEIATGIDSIKQFNFSASIQMKTVKVNVWTGVTTFEAYGIFKPSNSWISTTYKTKLLLDYFQLQYDITNAVSKQLEKDVNSKRINGGNKNKMDKVFNEYSNQVNQVLQKMDIDTEYGKNIEATNNWKAKLSNGTLLN